MNSQLALNTAPQDGLLIDNSKSYFTNVGYVRSSNFQMELRDVEPQNTANLGSSVTFVIPKAADLLGTLDLMVNMSKIDEKIMDNMPNDSYIGWVESLGYAMIEKLDFQIGSHSIESVSGQDLNLMNELMRGETSRHGFHQILKTGRPLVSGKIDPARESVNYSYDESTGRESHDRLIAYKDKFGKQVVKEGKRLCIPLSLLFTSHPSKYLPLAAIANCNDVRIVIKFRSWQDLVMLHTLPAVAGGTFATDAVSGAKLDLTGMAFDNTTAFAATSGDNEVSKGACTLRCQYIHLTGPEATALMGKEHVRIMKKWDQNRMTTQKLIKHSTTGETGKLEIDLNFLHPVQMLLITFQKVSEFNTSSTDGSAALTDGSQGRLTNQGARAKNYFAYHGGGDDPNMENASQSIKEDLAFGNGYKAQADNMLTVRLTGRPFTADDKVLVTCDTAIGALTTGVEYFVLSAGTPSGGEQTLTFSSTAASATAITFLASDFNVAAGGCNVDIAQVSAVGSVPYLDVKNFKLTINGHSRHLDGNGLDKDYLCNRMMPAMHSNAGEFYSQQAKSSGHASSDIGQHSAADMEMLSQFKDRKDIFVYPFAMNPQSDNPSGHVNFSKVSQARLQIDYVGLIDSLAGATTTVDDTYECQVIGLHYNWAAIKDGRMLVSFA